MAWNCRIPLIAVVVVLVIVGYFYTQVDWEARAVRKQFSELVELVEKDGAVSKFEALGRSRKLTTFFTDDASVVYYRARSLPRDTDAMAGAFLSVWGQLERASVTVLRHEVLIDESEAESQVTARCSVIMDGSEQVGDTLEYHIDWRKVDGDWRIWNVQPIN